MTLAMFYKRCLFSPTVSLAQSNCSHFHFLFHFYARDASSPPLHWLIGRAPLLRHALSHFQIGNMDQTFNLTFVVIKSLHLLIKFECVTR